MRHALLRYRPGSLIVSATAAGLTYAQTGLGGVSRSLTTVLAFVAAYLAFNATATAIESIASRE